MQAQASSPTHAFSSKVVVYSCYSFRPHVSQGLTISIASLVLELQIGRKKTETRAVMTKLLLLRLGSLKARLQPYSKFSYLPQPRIGAEKEVFYFEVFYVQVSKKK